MNMLYDVAKTVFFEAWHAALIAQTDLVIIGPGGQIVPTKCFMSGIAKHKTGLMSSSINHGMQLQAGTG